VVGWWNAGTEQMEHIIEYTPLGRVRLLAPDGSERCEEEGTGRDCVREFGLPQFGFASAYRSERSGLTYMRNRWYSTRLGQFLSHDPAGFADSHNLYAYASGDPVNFWDPFGLDPTSTADTRPETPEVPQYVKEFGAGAATEMAWTAGKSLLMANPVVLGAVGGYSLYSTGLDVLRARSASEGFDIANERLNPFMRTGRAWQAVQNAGSPDEKGAAVVRALEETATTALIVGGAAAASRGAAKDLGTRLLRDESGSVKILPDGTSSRAARREVMRQEDIPTSQQPSSQSRNESGRSYEYEVPQAGGGTEIKSVQQQTLDQSHPGQGHWEAGPVKINQETGEVRTNQYGRPKLKSDKSKVDYDE